jgi:hypothetical protein
VEDDNSTSKAVHSDKSPSKYEEADDDDDKVDFFTSESFLEVVSGIADDLDEPQKQAAKPPTSTTNRGDEQCSVPPPHKPTIMELAAMSEEEAAEAMKNYQILRKRWTDMWLQERRQKNFSNAYNK